MDPNAAWDRIIEAIKEGKPIKAIDACIDLAIWLNNGGAMPDHLTSTWTIDVRTYVWTVLDFIMGLDPDDTLRNATAAAEEGR
jgi:hypothetical protein